ncbi:MAG TPA: hypothetical protein VJU80_15580 [Solirubrobacteraceae bacterium]|nr:hypothetical protein [Solirubrobacteraceae bacterium]
MKYVLFVCNHNAGRSQMAQALFTPEEIRACADAILAQYADVPVRSFVNILAAQHARTCLRKATFDVLASV